MTTTPARPVIAAVTRVLVRPAVRTDLSRLGRLGALLVEEHRDFDSLRFLAGSPRTPTDYAAFLDAQIDTPSALVLVAHIDGDVIGYAYAAVEGTDYMALRGPAGVLHDLIVDPEYRGCGVGELLLGAALDALAAKGAPRVVLFTAARNVAGQRLFARSGFRPTMIEMTREIGEAATEALPVP